MKEKILEEIGMKKIVSMVMCLVLLCGVVGCTNRSNDVEKTVVISDINGDEVEIPQNPEKIVCRSGNGTSFVVGMGHSDKLVGTADYVLTNPWISVFMDNSEHLQGYGWSPSSEEIYKTGADLVMLADPDVAFNLRKDGIRAICYKQYNEQEILDSAKLIGKIMHEEEYASNWIQYYKSINNYIDSKLNAVEESDRPKVYYIYGQSNKGLGRTDGGGSITQHWVEGAGGVFTTKDLPNDGPKITVEEAISRNPDVILIGGVHSSALKDELLNSPEWSSVPAVKNNHIFQIPIGFTAWDFYGVEYPLLKLWVSKMLYPELIDKDMHVETKEFYKQFFGKDFSDEQIDYILKALNPEGNRYEN